MTEHIRPLLETATLARLENEARERGISTIQRSWDAILSDLGETIREEREQREARRNVL